MGVTYFETSALTNTGIAVGVGVGLELVLELKLILVLVFGLFLGWVCTLPFPVLCHSGWRHPLFPGKPVSGEGRFRERARMQWCCNEYTCVDFCPHAALPGISAALTFRF